MYYGLKWPCGADDLQQPHLVYIYDSCPRAIPPHGAESGLAGADSLGIGANTLRRSDAHGTRAKGVFISASAAHTSRIHCSPNWRIVSSVSAGLGRSPLGRDKPISSKTSFEISLDSFFCLSTPCPLHLADATLLIQTSRDQRTRHGLQTEEDEKDSRLFEDQRGRSVPSTGQYLTHK